MVSWSKRGQYRLARREIIFRLLELRPVRSSGAPVPLLRGVEVITTAVDIAAALASAGAVRGASEKDLADYRRRILGGYDLSAAWGRAVRSEDGGEFFRL